VNCQHHWMIYHTTMFHEADPIQVGTATLSLELLSICLLAFVAVVALISNVTPSSSSSEKKLPGVKIKCILNLVGIHHPILVAM
jgi:hypothetical protein